MLLEGSGRYVVQVDKQQLGQQIREWRDAAGFSLPVAAGLLSDARGEKISHQAIHAWETGAAWPGSTTWRSISP